MDVSNNTINVVILSILNLNLTYKTGYVQFISIYIRSMLDFLEKRSWHTKTIFSSIAARAVAIKQKDISYGTTTNT